MKQKKDLEEIVFNGKIPPQAVDLEEAVLGAAMLEGKERDTVMGLLKEDVFYSDSHKLIYGAINSIYKRNDPVDILTVTQELRKQGNLELSGGAFYVTQLTNKVASAANIEYHSHLIIQKYMMRQMIRIAGEMGKRAFEDTVDPFELKDQMLGELENVSKMESAHIQTIGDIAKLTLLKMKNDSILENDTIGLKSSIKALTEHTMGYCEPDLIILSAKSGEGKTTFALQEAFSIAKSGHPTAFVCLEMKGFQLCWKIFSSLIEESVQQIRLAKNISDPKWIQLEDEVRKMQNIPLYIIDATGLNINQITSLTKELKRKHKIEMLFIDYIQLVSGGSDQKFQNREGEMAYVSRKLKENCMKMSLPTMALSQLTIEKGTKRVYEIEDLRESKAIGHNADGVIFLYWPHYHGVETINEEYYSKNQSIIVIAKWRLGGTIFIKQKFIPQFNKFEDVNTIQEDTYIPGRDIRPYSEPIKEDSSENLPF